MNEERLTLAQAAVIAKVTATTLRGQIHKKKLKGTRVQESRGPVWYVTRADLDAYLAQRRTKESSA